jgi:single-strand DNA-binding protein
MNSCILMAEVVQDPQLRYTQDNQMAIAEMTVQFPALREEEAPVTLKVVGWGNLAQEVQETYRVGDRVIIEGRLNMNRIDRPEGFKETRPELNIQRIHRIGADATLSTNSAVQTSTLGAAAASAAAGTTAAAPPAARPAAPASRPAAPAAQPAKTPAYSAAPSPAKSAPEPVDYDEIPF